MRVSTKTLRAEWKSPANSLRRYPTIEAAVKALRPSQPVQCMHPRNLTSAAHVFLEEFPGLSFYAVKSNPDPYVLQRLHAAGIRHFDVASLNEIKLLRGLFADAHLAFLHPVKSREAIRAAYFEYGVRDFVLDSREELDKIREETGNAADLALIVRLAMPRGSAACSLAGKFGAGPELAAGLLREVAQSAAETGLSFHVGSQTLDPASYAAAIQKAGEAMRAAGVALAIFDIGGGFPVPGLGMEVPPLADFFAVIKDEVAKLNLPENCRLWSEPGRALSGTAATLLARIELRKGDALYLNDGSFGNMFEVCSMGWKNAVRLIRAPRKAGPAPAKTLVPFRFFGPTCDTVDVMPGPFFLPEDAGEGDWIAIECMGAYMAASQSRFNGFYSDLKIEVAPAPPRLVPGRKQGP
jgi:ornithine decarboxylase